MAYSDNKPNGDVSYIEQLSVSAHAISSIGPEETKEAKCPSPSTQVPTDTQKSLMILEEQQQFITKHYVQYGELYRDAALLLTKYEPDFKEEEQRKINQASSKILLWAIYQSLNSAKCYFGSRTTCKSSRDRRGFMTEALAVFVKNPYMMREPANFMAKVIEEFNHGHALRAGGGVIKAAEVIGKKRQRRDCLALCRLQQV